MDEIGKGEGYRLTPNLRLDLRVALAKRVGEGPRKRSFLSADRNHL